MRYDHHWKELGRLVETSPRPDAERPEMPNLCPTCARELVVTELSCADCQTTVKGRFSLGAVARLSKEQQRFLLVFVRKRGNIREVERELGLSYPTVRARLDQMLAALDSRVTHTEESASEAVRLEILSQLDRGEITAGEAVARLKTVASGRKT